MKRKLPTPFAAIIVWLLLISCFSDSYCQGGLSQDQRWVQDRTGTLSKMQYEALSRKLWNLYTSTSTQVVVSIYPSVPENTYMEAFVADEYQRLGIGREQEDNGVLLAIFVNDRKLRIEVGYGLEDVLTDLQSKRIIDYEIVPHFRNGDYYRGISAGIDAVVATVEGRYSIPVSSDREMRRSWIVEFVPLILMLILIIWIRYIRRRYSTTYSRRGTRRHPWDGPIILPPFGGGGGSRRSGGGFGGGGFGGFSGGGGMSGGGGASGSW